MGWGDRTKGMVLAAVCLSFVVPTVAAAGDFIFLNNGSVLQADKVEILGDTVRFETPTGDAVTIPRDRVLSIHPRGASEGVAPSPAQRPPARVYGNMTQQMNDQVRQQIQQGASAGQR